MKVYKVKVNGKVYEVELESVSEKDGHVVANKPVEAPAAQVAQSQAPAEGVIVKSPMQGTILKVNVQVGSQVKKGQCIAILEAMKLENEIVATADGVVKQVLVSKGQSVNNQDSLIVIG